MTDQPCAPNDEPWDPAVARETALRYEVAPDRPDEEPVYRPWAWPRGRVTTETPTGPHVLNGVWKEGNRSALRGFPDASLAAPPE